MPVRTDLDQLTVVDIASLGGAVLRPERSCARCDGAYAADPSWAATYVATDGEPFTVSLCQGCWTTTRTRLEREAFRRTRP